MMRWCHRCQRSTPSARRDTVDKAKKTRRVEHSCSICGTFLEATDLPIAAVEKVKTKGPEKSPKV